MRNICKDRKDFFKAVFNIILDKDTETEMSEDYNSFDDINPEEYEDLLATYIGDVIENNSDFTFNDMNIVVDNENIVFEDEDEDEEDEDDGKIGGLMYMHSFDSGELFFAFDCGGDWEQPVNAILYVEDGKVKYYVPEKGNYFNKKYMCAYGSEPNGEGEETPKNFKCDQSEELKDIYDYFANRADGEHANDKKTDTEEKKLNKLYCVSQNLWCMKKNASDECHISAHGNQSYANIFATYDEAVNYVHNMMMLNCSFQGGWEKFSQMVEIIDEGQNPSKTVGYFHTPMQNGFEIYRGFDLRGDYPCVVDDIMITERVVFGAKLERVKEDETENKEDDGGKKKKKKFNLKVLSDFKPYQVQHFYKSTKADAFTPDEHAQHQALVDEINKEVGGVDFLFEDSKEDEFEKMKNLMGYGEKKKGKKEKNEASNVRTVVAPKKEANPTVEAKTVRVVRVVKKGDN